MSAVLVLALVLGLSLSLAWHLGGRLVSSIALGLLLGPLAYVTLGMTLRKIPSLRSPRFYSWPFRDVVTSELGLLANLAFWSGSFGLLALLLGRRRRKA